MHGFHFAFVTKEKVIEYKSVTTIAHMSIIAFYFHLYHTYYIVLYTWHRLKFYGVLTFMKNIRHHNLFLIPFLVTIRFSATIFQLHLNLSKNIKKAYHALHMSRPNGYHNEISSTILILHGFEKTNSEMDMLL